LGMRLIADENSQHGPRSSHIGFALRKQRPQMRQSDGPLAPHCYHCALGTTVTVCAVIMGKKRKAASDGVDGAPQSKKISRSDKAEKSGNATDRKGLVCRTPSAPKRADDS
jgi:hypothetical protein